MAEGLKSSRDLIWGRSRVSDNNPPAVTPQMSPIQRAAQIRPRSLFCLTEGVFLASAVMIDYYGAWR